MKHRIYLVVMLVAVLALAASSALYAQPSYVIPLTISDNNSSLTRHFGLHPSAVYCIDSADNFLGYQEAQQPPIPPSPGPFEFRFVDPQTFLLSPTPCYDLGSQVDYRTSIGPAQSDTFQVYGQIANPEGSFSVVVSWPAGLSSACVLLEMRAYPSMTLIADMLTLTSAPVGAFAGDGFTFMIVMQPAAASLDTTKFLSVSPDTLAAKQLPILDPLKPKALKAVKRKKIPPLMPNWANLMDETVLQGGFAPPAVNGSTESDSAGGMRMGISFDYIARNSPDPLVPKWKPIKDSAAKYSWVRLGKWDFKKSIGKKGADIPKALFNKSFSHMDPGVKARGLDSTLNPGEPGRKKQIKELKKLDPKKAKNVLYAELLALKFNIAASQMEKTPAGFGELIYSMPGNPCDGLEITDISRKVDTVMTYYLPIDYTVPADPNQIYYDSLKATLARINRAFLGVLDTVSFDSLGLGKLVLKGQVPLSAVSFLSSGPTPPRIIRHTTEDGESEGEFEDDEFDESEDAPVTMKLYQNFPNPFNPKTSLAFRLLEPSLVTVRVYNILGQEVATLLDNEELEDGYQTVEFAANSLASGVYFYRVGGQTLDTEKQMRPIVGKMMLLK